MDEVRFIRSLDLQNPKSVLSKMEELSKYIEKYFGIIFCKKMIVQYPDLELREKFYSWLLFFSHTGIKKPPRVNLERKSGQLSIDLSNTFAIRNCGPIEVLNPQQINLSNTNFLTIGYIQNCKNLLKLNVSNTPLVALSSLASDSLKDLDISKTVIKKIDIENFPNLERLNVSHSSYSQFRFLDELKSLKVLIIDKSQAGKVSKLEGVKIIIKD